MQFPTANAKNLFLHTLKYSLKFQTLFLGLYLKYECIILPMNFCRHSTKTYKKPNHISIDKQFYSRYRSHKLLLQHVANLICIYGQPLKVHLYIYKLAIVKGLNIRPSY